MRRERWPGDYEIQYVPLVKPGEQVEADQPVMRIVHSEMVGTGPFPKVPRLSLPANASQGLPGVINERRARPGEVLLAGLRGTVTALTRRGSVVIGSQVAIVSGMIGTGKQVTGPLSMWQAPGTMQGESYIPPGAILVVPGPLNLAMLRQALYSGLAGIVASSILARDLEHFLHADLIELLNSANPALFLNHLPPLTILLTEGLGTLAMPRQTLNLLSRYQGISALLTGATSIRARKYPELAISLPEAEKASTPEVPFPETSLRTGALVRICSGHYAGVAGKITYMFAYRQTFPSGIRVRAARVHVEDGPQLVLPLASLERIG